MIGIVASRLVERYNRPVVIIAGTDGEWKGSGRSVPAFDLHAGLGACAGHLERFGGHRAAAGLTIEAERVETFAAAFAAHADATLSEDDLRPVTRIDAIVPGAKLGLDLCAELQRLAPFGHRQPGVVLLVDGCELAEPSTVGDGKHLRFRVRQRGRDAGSAIAFGMGGQLDRFRREERYDVAFRLQENRWNGTVVASARRAPRLRRRDGFEGLRDWLAGQWRAGEASWTPEARAIFAELELADGAKRSLLESATFRALLEAAAAARRGRLIEDLGRGGRTRADRIASWRRRHARRRSPSSRVTETGGRRCGMHLDVRVVRRQRVDGERGRCAARRRARRGAVRARGALSDHRGQRDLHGRRRGDRRLRPGRSSSSPTRRRSARRSRTRPGRPSSRSAASPTRSIRPRAWEQNATVFPLFGEGDYNGAKRALTEALDRYEDREGLLYNLACAEARLGETEAAIGHLGESIALRPSFAELARDDEDLDAIRERPALRRDRRRGTAGGLDPADRGAAAARDAHGPLGRCVELPEHPGDLEQLLRLSASLEHGARLVHRHNGISS